MARLHRDEAGAAVVEFAMVLPLFLLLMSGLFDGARLINAALQVNAAAQAGVSYARKNGWDAAGVAAAVTAATPIAATAQTATLSVGCLKNGSVVAAGANGACPGGQPAGGYAVVTAQAPFAPRAPWPVRVWPSVLTAQAMARVQ